MPVTSFQREYTVGTFDHLYELKSITKDEVDVHLKLYQGYVKNVNSVRATILELFQSGDGAAPQFAELVRRLGFEYNGMRLHELYFENLSGTSSGPSQSVIEAITNDFESWENWEQSFRTMATIRGVGWLILYRDPITGVLSNHWINMHEDGHPVGFEPILVMDCWEHAWAGYLKPTDRAQYIDDFYENINWEVVEKRLNA